MYQRTDRSKVKRERFSVLTFPCTISHLAWWVTGRRLGLIHLQGLRKLSKAIPTLSQDLKWPTSLETNLSSKIGTKSCTHRSSRSDVVYWHFYTSGRFTGATVDASGWGRGASSSSPCAWRHSWRQEWWPLLNGSPSLFKFSVLYKQQNDKWQNCHIVEASNKPTFDVIDSDRPTLTFSSLQVLNSRHPIINGTPAPSGSGPASGTCTGRSAGGAFSNYWDLRWSAAPETSQTTYSIQMYSALKNLWVALSSPGLWAKEHLGFLQVPVVAYSPWLHKQIILSCSIYLWSWQARFLGDFEE